MAQATSLEVIYNNLADIVFISTNDSDECDTSKGTHGVFFHVSKADQSPRSVTLTDFKTEWINARNEIMEAVSGFLKMPQPYIESKITAAIQLGPC